MSAVLIIQSDGSIDALRLQTATAAELLELAHACALAGAQLLELHQQRKLPPVPAPVDTPAALAGRRTPQGNSVPEDEQYNGVAVAAR